MEVSPCPGHTAVEEQRAEVGGAVLATPPSLARPIPEQRAREVWTGPGHAARPRGTQGMGRWHTKLPAPRSGLVAVCRLRHAELGKSAPATHRAGGKVAGQESGSRSCSGLGVGVEHPEHLRDSAPQSPQSTRPAGVEEGGAGEPGKGRPQSPSASRSLKPQFHPKGSACPHLPSPLRSPQRGQLGGCYLMPSAAPNRPKPDAGHLGHPGGSAPIPLGTGTRSGPPPAVVRPTSRAPRTRP